VSVDAGSGLIEVLARWCLDAAEHLVRAGLRKEYKSAIDEVEAIRGRVLECATLVAVLRGRLVSLCEFEDLSDDSPMNRVVRAACERLARLEVLSDVTRGRARRVAYRMDGVGPLEFADLRVRPDRASRAYARVLPLAFLVLAGCGISASVGQHVGSAFLVRTPELIEDGLRAIVRDALPGVDVAKRRLLLGDSGLSVNPDLLLGNGVAVGDVKYKFLGADWNRSDLNQVVTFATAFHCSHALVIGFARDATASRPRTVPVGPVRAASLAWVASPELDPVESCRQLEVQIRSWMPGLGVESALSDSSR
jgi:5-methylcytosine-specific restriction endonuclease McrBC regulatory subunit McrC